MAAYAADALQAATDGARKVCGKTVIQETPAMSPNTDRICTGEARVQARARTADIMYRPFDGLRTARRSYAGKWPRMGRVKHGCAYAEIAAHCFSAVFVGWCFNPAA